jgi:chorismate dehydratase
MKPVVASVPYLNAKPLIYKLTTDDSVELMFDVPSKLPAMVDSGKASVAMASSFDAVKTPGRKVVDGVSISTLNQVESVRLFSKVPLKEITTLALDTSSLTSNHLALILLAEMYGIKPKTQKNQPDINGMLTTSDACVLIGDKGLTSEYPNAHILDMGSAWRELTGLPFVWALWIGGADLDVKLADKLRTAKEWGANHLDVVVPWASSQTGIDENTCSNYLRHTMSFDLTGQHLAGLGAYAEYLKKHGFVANPEPIALT